MSRFLFSLFISFSLLILSNVESHGQCASCPSGYTSESVNHVLSNGCEVTINYCLFCQPTGHGAVRLCSVTIPYTNDPFDPCYNLVIDGIFWDEIREAMTFNSAVECGNIGPCPQRMNYEVYQASCMQAVIEWTPYPPRYVLKPCPQEAGECMQEFEICWEPTGFKITKQPPVLLDPGECSPGAISLDPNNLFLDCFNSCW